MDEILKLFGGAENIWIAIQQNASRVGIEATRIMLELFYVLKSPSTGVIDKTLIVAALGYQLLPEDVLPRDEYGILGFLDNGVTIAFAYNRVKASVTSEIEQQVNNVLANWFGAEAFEQPTQEVPAIDNGNGASTNYAPTVLTNTIPGQHIPPQPPQQSRPKWNDDEDVVID